MSTTLTAPPPPTAPARDAGADRDADYVTAAEYLRREETADTKHEWYDGEVREMAGASLEHDTLAGEVFFQLKLATRGKPFQVLTSDIKVRIPDGPYVYTDGVVAASPPDMEPPVRPGGPRTVLLNPVAIVEVLSESTEETDRGEKLDGYRRIPSLTDYLMFSQHEPRVDHRHRPAAGRWELTIVRGADASVRLAGLGVEVGMVAVYGVPRRCQPQII